MANIKTIQQKIKILQEETKYFNLNYDDLDNNIVDIYTKTNFYKEYPRFQKIKLPSPKISENNKNIFQILSERKSYRVDKVSKNKITINQLSTLLYYSFGIKEINNNDYNNTKRFWPSAGGKYPIEAYIYINQNIDKIKKGLYHYNVKTNSLVNLNFKLSYKQLNNLHVQSILQNYSIIIFLTFEFQRTVNKYGDRGFRFLYLDCGHLSQNILLLSTALKLKSCCFGGPNEELIENHILDIDTGKEILGYIIGIKN